MSKNLVPIFTLFLASSLLTGCAQVYESLESVEKPENAPPGYHNFTAAQKAEKKGEIEQSCWYYCGAAELGHPKAKEKCIKYAYLAARKNLTNICEAEDYDKKAKEICRMRWLNWEGAQKELKAEIARRQQKQVKSRIQKGEFSEFKTEEF